ncbi:subunit of TIM23 translocase complex [Ophidiomyces ophidiicola]|nr:subunit of TIM23 translocase complex [Ophidiomyces ophidiicola]KAI1940054.1 subunit of TIM23 translocase complex [Ophidiomyces ophidiicola]KAI1966557.1 subunit of TIM23 translocase complex [Ophidiomyces ophidiicola]
MPPVAAPSGGGMRGPSTVDKLKMGAMMGGSVGLIMGFIIGTVSIFQYGAGPNGIMRTLGKYMAGSAATFGYAPPNFRFPPKLIARQVTHDYPKPGSLCPLEASSERRATRAHITLGQECIAGQLCSLRPRLPSELSATNVDPYTMYNTKLLKRLQKKLLLYSP